jgi:hypothetical protein
MPEDVSEDDLALITVQTDYFVTGTPDQTKREEKQEIYEEHSGYTWYCDIGILFCRGL